MSSRTLFEGRFLVLAEIDGWEYCTRTTGAAVATVVAVTDDAKLLLTEQFRPPLGTTVIELPAGLVGDEPGQETESVLLAGARELEEETGYRAEQLSRLAAGPTSAGLTDETIHFLLARDLKRVHQGGGIGDENIIVHAVPLDHVPDFLASASQRGAAVDPKVYAGLWFARTTDDQ